MTLHIHNLGDEITSDSLEAVFATHGTVLSFTLIKDQCIGGADHHAVVEMSSDLQAQQAIDKVNGFILNGRAIVVCKTG